MEDTTDMVIEKLIVHIRHGVYLSIEDIPTVKKELHKLLRAIGQVEMAIDDKSSPESIKNANILIAQTGATLAIREFAYSEIVRKII
jgi:hypothetical protein